MKKCAQRKISFLVALLFLAAGIRAQETASRLLTNDWLAFQISPAKLQPVKRPEVGKELLSLPGKFDYLRPVGTAVPVVPSNIYYQQSGFFCKREWELERTTHVPFRFRLGSLDQCNALEGKR